MSKHLQLRKISRFRRCPVYESGMSPCKTYCNGTITLYGHVLGKDAIGNLLYAYAGSKIGFDLTILSIAGEIVSLWDKGERDYPEDKAQYVFGLIYSKKGVDFALDESDISSMQSEAARRGWPSCDSFDKSSWTVYPTFLPSDNFRLEFLNSSPLPMPQMFSLFE